VRARNLYEAGQLEAAIAALGDELRSDPLDLRRRTFLFELLCFAGDYERAGKQLEVLARGSREADLGAWLYRSALHAERTRQDLFTAGAYPDRESAVAPVAGELNGVAFSELVDADPRIGARLEVFAGGEYLWLPFAQVAALRIEPPRRLRDLLWLPARVQPRPEYGGELGEVLLPAIAPLTWHEADAELRLGRAADWVESGEGEYLPVGQKLLLVDGEPFPLVEVRELVLAGSPVAASD
jgi:type VI secretion system protein ImpE